jgi:phosphate-selective porin
MFGLEQLMSQKRIAFVERSLTSALSPGRNLGLGMGKTVSSGKVSISGGIFRNSRDNTSYRGNKRNGTLRFTVAPWMDTESGKVLHLGAAGSFRQAERDPEDGKTKLRYAAIPESNLLPQLIDTGLFEADAAVHVDGEFATIWRNSLLQAEYVYVATDAAVSGDPVFSAFYVYGSYFNNGRIPGVQGRCRTRHQAEV